MVNLCSRGNLRPDHHRPNTCTQQRHYWQLILRNRRHTCTSQWSWRHRVAWCERSCWRGGRSGTDIALKHAHNILLNKLEKQWAFRTFEANNSEQCFAGHRLPVATRVDSEVRVRRRTSVETHVCWVGRERSARTPEEAVDVARQVAEGRGEVEVEGGPHETGNSNNLCLYSWKNCHGHSYPSSILAYNCSSSTSTSRVNRFALR